MTPKMMKKCVSLGRLRNKKLKTSQSIWLQVQRCQNYTHGDSKHSGGPNGLWPTLLKYWVGHGLPCSALMSPTSFARLLCIYVLCDWPQNEAALHRHATIPVRRTQQSSVPYDPDHQHCLIHTHSRRYRQTTPWILNRRPTWLKWPSGTLGLLAPLFPWYISIWRHQRTAQWCSSWSKHEWCSHANRVNRQRTWTYYAELRTIA